MEAKRLLVAYDEQTGEQAYKEVVQLFRGETDKWYHIKTCGEEIVCTGNHPFYVKGKGFVKAKDLTLADKLVLSDNSEVVIDEITIEQLEKPETKYNFEVADFHTYYVTEKSILVHNKCGGNVYTKDQQAVIDLAREAKKAGGISRAEANTLVDWAKEYGINAHYPGVHPNRPLSMWSKTVHINIANMHIPVL